MDLNWKQKIRIDSKVFQRLKLYFSNGSDHAFSRAMGISLDTPDHCDNYNWIPA